MEEVKTYHNNKTFGKWLLIISFIGIITLPLVGPKETESLEKRELSEFPKWRWSNIWIFFKDYQPYFNDRFAYKNTTINFYGLLKYEVLKLNNLKDNAIIGHNNWLYLNKRDYVNNVVNNFTEEELQQIHYNLYITTKWFETKGIKYYFTVSPVKPHIYPEHSPPYLFYKFQHTKINQLSEYLNKHSEFTFIDYRNDLLDMKKKYPLLYYKSDTHWNEIGAFIGYKKIMATIAKDFKELTPNDFKDFYISSKKLNGGDLQNLLGYNSKNQLIWFNLHPKDSLLPKLKYPNNPIHKISEYSENLNILTDYHEFEAWEMEKAPNSLKLFVVRDSFSQHLKKFLSRNFKRSYYAWMPSIPIYKVAEEKPDIIVHQMLERFLSTYLELPPEIKNDTAFTNQFNIEDF